MDILSRPSEIDTAPATVVKEALLRAMDNVGDSGYLFMSGGPWVKGLDRVFRSMRYAGSKEAGNFLQALVKSASKAPRTAPDIIRLLEPRVRMALAGANYTNFVTTEASTAFKRLATLTQNTMSRLILARTLLLILEDIGKEDDYALLSTEALARTVSTLTECIPAPPTVWSLVSLHAVALGREGTPVKTHVGKAAGVSGVTLMPHNVSMDGDIIRAYVEVAKRARKVRHNVMKMLAKRAKSQ